MPILREAARGDLIRVTLAGPDAGASASSRRVRRCPWRAQGLAAGGARDALLRCGMMIHCSLRGPRAHLRAREPEATKP